MLLISLHATLGHIMNVIEEILCIYSFYFLKKVNEVHLTDIRLEKMT